MCAGRMAEEGYVPIELSSVRRHCRVMPPPPLRLYNPSRLIGFSGNNIPQRYTFVNPFTQENVMMAAYASILKSPSVDGMNVDVERNTRSTWPRRHLLRERSLFDMDRDPWESSIFGYSPDGGRNSRNVRGESPLHDYFDFGWRVFNSMWSEFNPFRSNQIYPWDDSTGYERDSVLSDLHNYRIATHGHKSPSWELQTSGVRGEGSNTYRLFDDVHSAWGTDSGLERSENDRFYKVRFRLPGVEEEDIKVKINGGVLTVNARSGKVKDGDSDGSRMQYSQRFQHSVSLPRDAMERRAKANLANGTLTISIPRRLEKTSWD